MTPCPFTGSIRPYARAAAGEGRPSFCEVRQVPARLALLCPEDRGHDEAGIRAAAVRLSRKPTGRHLSRERVGR
jgi:hypothetical protein